MLEKEHKQPTMRVDCAIIIEPFNKHSSSMAFFISCYYHRESKEKMKAGRMLKTFSLKKQTKTKETFIHLFYFMKKEIILNKNTLKHLALFPN